MSRGRQCNTRVQFDFTKALISTLWEVSVSNPQQIGSLSSGSGHTVSSISAISSGSGSGSNKCLYSYVSSSGSGTQMNADGTWPGQWKLQSCNCGFGFTNPGTPTQDGHIGELLIVACVPKS